MKVGFSGERGRETEREREGETEEERGGILHIVQTPSSAGPEVGRL